MCCSQVFDRKFLGGILYIPFHMRSVHWYGKKRYFYIYIKFIIGSKNLLHLKDQRMRKEPDIK